MAARGDGYARAAWRLNPDLFGADGRGGVCAAGGRGDVRGWRSKNTPDAAVGSLGRA